ncbi:DNA polymerase III subunit epsilon [Paenalkalicoccus suaedae]|uniref:DNA polymerase III subunit epsilon n=1 Tax=Paenalkalicoccus suaedae TaxID=2592382 RepID=A0A859FCM8_9BACI|nr:exonuclease domain-containing protein [Paenalkalicoccus suaedae]QKS70512.1 DNA polymerase III subunit epsilon [Paenalkalicoccus suaedae]
MKIAFVDVETTGMSPGVAEILELGIVLAEFKDGHLTSYIDEYCEFQDPMYQIPPMITELTGITNDMVSGKYLDHDRLLTIFDQADAIVAHNASFDRGFITRVYPETKDYNWYCSVRQIKWKTYGFLNGKLQQLLAAHRIEMPNAHRALDDAKGLATLLNKDFPGATGEKTYIDYLLQKKPMKRIGS